MISRHLTPSPCLKTTVLMLVCFLVFSYAAVSFVRNQSICSYDGPWVVLVVGAVESFLGYFLIWLSVVGAIQKSAVAVMCIFMLVAAHGQTFFNTANVVTAVQNFPEYTETIVGIMKGFLGLRGAMLIQVYLAIFKGNPSTFILMLAVLPSTVTFFLMFLVRIYPEIELMTRRNT